MVNMWVSVFFFEDGILTYFQFFKDDILTYIYLTVIKEVSEFKKVMYSTLNLCPLTTRGTRGDQHKVTFDLSDGRLMQLL